MPDGAMLGRILMGRDLHYKHSQAFGKPPSKAVLMVKRLIFYVSIHKNSGLILRLMQEKTCLTKAKLRTPKRHAHK